MNLVRATEARQSDLPACDWVRPFQMVVVEWFDEHGRDFPWRQTRNPYHILVAEVLLRRTQAIRVVSPYLELVRLYPTAQKMSEAETSWLREWFKPLGLVRRADQLVRAAKFTVEQYGGSVPQTLEQLSNFPGIGRYSARAIQCLAYGAPVPMIDESSGRLLRRMLGLAKAGPAYSDRSLLSLAERLVPDDAGRAFNLGLLDIAASYCHSSSPSCLECPLQSFCSWGRSGPASKKNGVTYAGP